MTLRTRQLETWLAYLDATRLLFDELDSRLRDESDLPWRITPYWRALERPTSGVCG